VLSTTRTAHAGGLLLPPDGLDPVSTCEGGGVVASLPVAGELLLAARAIPPITASMATTPTTINHARRPCPGDPPPERVAEKAGGDGEPLPPAVDESCNDAGGYPDGVCGDPFGATPGRQLGIARERLLPHSSSTPGQTN
jgi:hypothetical protein